MTVTKRLPLLSLTLCVFLNHYIESTAASSWLARKVKTEARYNDGSAPIINDVCDVQCNTTSKYRTADGSCNNIENPCWGKSLRTFNALMDRDYSDGIACPRAAVPGTTPLPPERLVSRVVHRERNITAHKRSDLFLSFGQFQTHDAGVASLPDGDNTIFQCPATKDNFCSEGLVVPKGDKFWSQTCAFFPQVKSMRCNGNGIQCGCSKCKSGQLQFGSDASAFLDGSNVYGATSERMEQLREPGTGYLRMDGDVLARTKYPESSASSCETSSPTCNDTCFDAGDKVANSNFLLLSFYTTWFKEHNRLVDKLKAYISDPDILFQEARKIVGAMIQHIVYAEYLPLVFGNCLPPELKVPTLNGRQYGYDANLDPTVTGDCNFAGCRYGHSEIRGNPKLYHEKRTLNIGKLFFNIGMFCEKRMVSKIMGGMTEQTAMQEDRYVASPVTDWLHFPGQNDSDLIAIGLRRGRDTGVPPYLKYFKFCGLKEPQNYEELKEYVEDEAVEDYRKIYGEDGMGNIDMYSAILSEKHLPHCTGFVGAITQCIVANHHRGLKLGDRLWYENLGQPESFTEEQILEIQKTTISRIVCSNTDLRIMQKHGFLIRGHGNRLKRCHKIIKKGDIDISKWKQ